MEKVLLKKFFDQRPGYHNIPTEDDDLDKCILELHQTATINPRQIERLFFFTGFQWTNSNLQTGLRSNGGSVLEKCACLS